MFTHAIVELMLNSYHEQKPKTYHYNLSEVYLRSCVSNNNCFTLRALTRNGKYPLICTSQVSLMVAELIDDQTRRPRMGQA